MQSWKRWTAIRIISSLTLLTFSFQQIIYAAPPLAVAENLYEQQSKKIFHSSSSDRTSRSREEVDGSLRQTSRTDPPSVWRRLRSNHNLSSQDFLQDTLSLTPHLNPLPQGGEENSNNFSLPQRRLEKSNISPLPLGEGRVRVRETHGNENYEQTYYSVDEALDLIRPEFAAAIPIKNLSVEDLKKLLKADVEWAAVEAHGQKFILTTGQVNEISTDAELKSIMADARVVGHFQPAMTEATAPSLLDLVQATDRLEYQLSPEIIVSYNKEGVIEVDVPAEEFLKAWDTVNVISTTEGRRNLDQSRSLVANIAPRDGALNATRYTLADARAWANRFVAAADRLNRENILRENLRASGTVAPDSTLTSANLTNFTGTPWVLLQSGSSSATNITQSSNSQFIVNYDVSAAGSFAAASVSFDNPTTASTVETANLSALTDLIVGVKGPAGAKVKFEVEDSAGHKSDTLLINIASSLKYYKISKTLFSGIDWAQVKSLNYIIDATLTSSLKNALTIQTKTLLYNTARPTALPSSPRPMVLAGSTPATFLTEPAASQIKLNFNVTPSASSFSAATFSADDPGTSNVETLDFSQGDAFTFGVQSGTSSLTKINLEVEDGNGIKVTKLLTITTGATYFTFQKASFTGIDWTKFKRMNFVVDRSMISSSAAYKSTVNLFVNGFLYTPTVTWTSTLTSANVSTLPGSPALFLLPGSSTLSTLGGTSTSFDLSYDLTASGSLSGARINYDKPSTTAVEVRNFSSVSNLVFGLSAPANTVRMDLVDKTGKKSSVFLIDVAATEKYFKVNLSSFTGIDKANIRSIEFILDPVVASHAAKTGTLHISTKTLTAPSFLAPAVDSFNATTTRIHQVITGTKGLGAGIAINGAMVVPPTDSTSWRAEIDLAPGIENVLQIQETNGAGALGPVKEIRMTHQTSLADGTTYFYTGNVLTRERLPNMDDIYFLSGSPDKYRYADGREVRYVLAGVRRYDAAGTLIETIDLPTPTVLEETQALKLSLQDGVDAFYVDGILKEMRQNGVRVTDFTLDAQNNIVNAYLVYPDGTLEIIRDTVLLRRISPDGSIMDFMPNGSPVREIFADHTDTYTFDKISQTQLADTVVTSSNGAVTRYDELGILRDVKDAAGKQYVYTRQSVSGGYQTSLYGGISSVPSAKTMTSAKYDLQGVLEEMVLQDGTKIEFASGRIQQVLDSQGHVISDYAYADLSSSLQIVRSGTQFNYDGSGFLQEIHLADGSVIQRTAEDTNHNGNLNDETVSLLLEAVGGDSLTDFTLDANGNIVNGIIETKEGIKQTIQNGVLTGFETVDGKIYDFANNQAVLKEWHFKDGTRIIYGGATISQILNPDGSRLHTIGFSAKKEVESFTEELADGTKKYFETRDPGHVTRLVRLITPTGAEIQYGADGLAEKVILSDQSEELVEYIYGDGPGRDGLDASPSLPGPSLITFHGAHTSRAYSPDGTLLNVLTGGVNAAIQSGEVSKLFTRFGTVEAPQFSSNGILSGEVVFADGTRQILQDGNLIQTIRPNGTKVNYTNGRINSVEKDGELYTITYQEQNGKFTDVRIREGGEEFPLVPYLIEPEVLLGDKLAYFGDSGLDASQAKWGSASAHFDGNGDYIQIPSSTDWNFGSGGDPGADFTIDFWTKFQDLSGFSSLVDTGDQTGIRVIWRPEGQLAAYMNGEEFASAWAAQTNQWYHVAIVRQGTWLKFFVDGTQLGSGKDIGSRNAHDTGGVRLGMTLTGIYPLKGWMDEVRITKGVARWWNNFPAPSQEDISDADTKLLLHFRSADEYRPVPDEIAQIVASRPLEDVFGSRSKIQSDLQTSDGNSHTLFFAKMTGDFERAKVYEFGDDYYPEWADLAGNPSDYNQGYISRNVTMDVWDHLPALTTELIDMNGDGLTDRVYIDTNANVGYWWVQFNTGQDFAAPVKWTNVNQRVDPAVVQWYNYTMGSMRFYEGRHPHMLGNLIDLNGDDRPDRVMQKLDGSKEWYVQFNNGSGFDPMILWSTNIHPLSQGSSQATYAQQVRNDSGGKNVQELIADLIDMDGDGLADRILRPGVSPYDRWFFQKNLGEAGFADAVSWQGVDTSFDSDPAIGGSLSWHSPDWGNTDGVAEVSLFSDMNGDKLPDRVLLKNQNPNDSNSQMDWYVQFNNGSGFDAASLWDNTVRVVPGAPNAKMGSSIRWFNNANTKRWLFADLKDVTGDGLPDRVTLDQASDNAQSTWWVEVNTGSSFAPAVAWAGIYGTDGAQTSIGQDNLDFRSNRPSDRTPSYVKQVSDLIDITGDGILDRVIFPEGSNHWLVQFGTGSGFLPVQEMKIPALEASANQVRTSRYDYVHVSVKAAQAIDSSVGAVKVTLGQPEIPESYQEWTIQQIGTEWQDLYLPIDKTKSDASQVKLEFEPVNANTSIPIYVDNVTFTSFRAPAAKDWLDRMLTEENVLSEIHSERTQTLAQYLGYVDDGSDPVASLFTLNASQLLSAETRIDFNSAGEATQFQTFYGSVSQIEDNVVKETVLPNGTKIEFAQPSSLSSQSFTQTVTKTDGSVETNDLSYGRVRSVSRPNASPLEYSYEFCPQEQSAALCGGWPEGTEITVVRDPDTNIVERYASLSSSGLTGGSNEVLVSRTLANGITHSFEYASVSSPNVLIGDPSLDSRFRGNDSTLVRTTISYKGRVHETFEHGISEAGNKVLTTEDGTQEEYDASGKILFHTTSEGYQYAHSFEKARKVVTTLQTQSVNLPDGTTFTTQIPMVTLEDCNPAVETCEDVHRVRLVGYREAGSGKREAEYDGAVLKSLVLSDFASQDTLHEIRILFDRTETVDTFDPETGETEHKINPLDVLVFHGDGTITEYRNGKPFSITTATGRVIDILSDSSLVTSDPGHEPQVTSYVINPSESAQFHYAQALKLWNEIVIPKFTEFQAPGTLPVQMEYSATGDLVTREFAEGVVELYESGKISQVVSRTGERLVTYEYDANGNPTAIHMESARRRLDSAALKLRAEIAVEHEKALAKVADRESVLNQTIEGQYVTTRDRLLAIRAQIEAEQNKVASIEVRGKKAKSVLGDAMGTIQAGLDQVNTALAQLAQNRNQALAQLHQQVADLKAQIENETADSYVQIAAEEKKAQDQILRQEISPVVYHWYRKILGRDPSRTEYSAIIDAIDYEAAPEGGDAIPQWLTDLKNQLLSSQELQERTTQVEAIKNRVETELLNYLTLSDADKIDFAQSLGIDFPQSLTPYPLPLPLVSLSNGEASSILTWLRAQSLHFGQSAYLALEALLADSGAIRLEEGEAAPEGGAGVYFTRVELASRLILIDILTGTLTPMEQSDLVISIYALRKVAAGYGLSTTGYGLTYDALKSIFDEARSTNHDTRLIAHINGDHFVIVTNVTDTDVSYIDPGAGPENHLDTVTLSKDEFMEAWVDPSRAPEHPSPDTSDAFGYVLSTRAPPSSVLSTQYSVLNTQQEQSIRGAFFPFLIPIFIAVVTAIAHAVAAVVSGIVALIGGIISGIGSILTGFGQIFGGLFTGQFAASLHAGFASILHGFGLIGQGLGSFFGSFHQALIAGVQGYHAGYGIGLAALSTNSALAGALNLSFIGLGVQGVGSLLQKMGISPKIVQTIISGGKIVAGIGLLATGNPLGIAASLGFVSGGTSEFLALHTSLSPTLTNIIGIGASALGAFAVGGVTGGISGAITALTKSAPYLSMDLASAGVVAVGNQLGLDPRITSLISVPVRAIVGNVTGNALGLSDFNSVLKSIINDTTGGLVSVGASIGLDAIGAPSILQSFIPALISGLVQGLGESDSVPGGSGDTTSQQKGVSIFRNIADNIAKFGSGIANVIDGVISFGQKIIEGVGSVTKAGFAKAVDFFSNIFDRQTQETLRIAGNGSIENAVLNSAYFDADEIKVNFNGEEIAWGLNTEALTLVKGKKTFIFNKPSISGGLFFFENLAFADEIEDGIILHQDFERNKLKELYTTDKNGNKIWGLKLDGLVDPLNFGSLGEWFPDKGVLLTDYDAGITFDLKNRELSGLRFDDFDSELWNEALKGINNVSGTVLSPIERIGRALESAGDLPLNILGDFAISGISAPIADMILSQNPQQSGSVALYQNFIKESRNFFEGILKPEQLTIGSEPNYEVINKDGLLLAKGQAGGFQGKIVIERDLLLGKSTTSTQFGVADLDGKIVWGTDDLNISFKGSLDATKAKLEGGMNGFLPKAEALIAALELNGGIGVTVNSYKLEIDLALDLGAFGGALVLGDGEFGIKYADVVGGGFKVKFKRDDRIR